MDAEKFAERMNRFVSQALIKSGSVPEGFDEVDQIHSHIQVTRSGIILGIIDELSPPC